MEIDPDSKLPLYAQVEAALALAISSGASPAGERLPSEADLAARFGVSRITIRQTIQNLIRRGLVEIQRGKGTFVTEPRITQELSGLSGFVEDMQLLGLKPSTKVLDKQTVPASDAVARQLCLPAGTPVVRIRRVRFADGLALSFDETYLLREIGERIVDNDLESEPIFSLLEQKYNIPLVEAEYRLEAVAADAAVAKALGIAVARPIFLIERTSFTSGHKPIDYERLYYRGDKTRFVTRLQRRKGAGGKAAGR